MIYGTSAGQPVANARNCARSESSSSVVQRPTLAWVHNVFTQFERAEATRSIAPCVWTTVTSRGALRALRAKLVSSMSSIMPATTSWFAQRHSPRAQLCKSMPPHLDNGTRLTTLCLWPEKRMLSS